MKFKKIILIIVLSILPLTACDAGTGEKLENEIEEGIDNIQDEADKLLEEGKDLFDGENTKAP